MISRIAPGRTLAALAIAAAWVAVAAGCGNAIPPSAVAKVGDSTITKAEFERWLKNAAAGQSQGGPAAAPDPPTYEKCVASLKKQPQPQAAGKPSDEQLKKQCKQQYETLRDQVMQFLIQAQWVMQEAEERGVNVSDAEVKKSFEDRKKKAYPKEADYKKFLEDSGLSEDDILFQVKLDQLQTKLVQKVTEGSKAPPSDEEIAAFYEKKKKQFATPESRDVNLVLTKTEAKAQEAKEELEDGASFKDVAKEYSIDQQTKTQGGKLAGLTKGQQDKDLEEAAFNADKGELEGPLKAQFGYYVFKVTAIKEAAQPSLEEVKDSIVSQLRSEKEQKALEAFVKDFRERYKKLTECAEGYRIAECSNAPKEDKTSEAPASGGAPGGAPQGTPPPQGAPPTSQGAPPVPQGAPPVPQGAPPTQPPPPSGASPPADPAPQGPASP